MPAWITSWLFSIEKIWTHHKLQFEGFREQTKYNVRLPCTNYFKASFSYSGTALWNRLPFEATIEGTRNPSGRSNAKSAKLHSRPQRPRSFWSAPRIATSSLVQRHSVFEWLSKHNRLRPEPIRFVKLDSEHAQSNGKSVNRGLPVLDLARGRDSWCWPKGARPLGTRMAKLHKARHSRNVTF